MKRIILLFLFFFNAKIFATQNHLFAIRKYQNQTLTHIDIANNIVNDSVASIGPTANSLVIFDEQIYVVNSGDAFIGINASLQIFDIEDIINNDSLTPITIPIPDGKSPYDIIFLNETRAYISCFMSGSVLIFNPQTLQIENEINIGSGPEGMAIYGDKLYVAQSLNPSTFISDSSITVISILTNKIIDTIFTYKNPQKIFVDNFGNLNIVCTGNWFANDGEIDIYNPLTNQFIGFAKCNASISDVAINTENIGFASGYYSGANIKKYNTLTADTMTSNLTEGDIVIDNNNFLYVGRNGTITIYNSITLDSISTFYFEDAEANFSLVIFSDEEQSVLENNFPKQFSLKQNYPNPFNPKTKIKYEIAKSGFVSLKIYDVLGREIKTIVNENKNVGFYEIDFDANNLNSGIYFYKLTTNNFSEMKKMILIK